MSLRGTLWTWWILVLMSTIWLNSATVVLISGAFREATLVSALSFSQAEENFCSWADRPAISFSQSRYSEGDRLRLQLGSAQALSISEVGHFCFWEVSMWRSTRNPFMELVPSLEGRRKFCFWAQPSRTLLLRLLNRSTLTSILVYMTMRWSSVLQPGWERLPWQQQKEQGKRALRPSSIRPSRLAIIPSSTPLLAARGVMLKGFWSSFSAETRLVTAMPYQKTPDSSAVRVALGWTRKDSTMSVWESVASLSSCSVLISLYCLITGDTMASQPSLSLSPLYLLGFFLWQTRISRASGTAELIRCSALYLNSILQGHMKQPSASRLLRQSRWPKLPIRYLSLVPQNEQASPSPWQAGWAQIQLVMANTSLSMISIGDQSPSLHCPPHSSYFSQLQLSNPSFWPNFSQSVSAT